MRTRKQKKRKVRKPEPLFSKKELRELAAMSWKYRPFDICNLAKISYKDRAAMFADTNAILQGHEVNGKEIEMLQYFLSTLKNIGKAEEPEGSELMRRSEAMREHKKDMVKLVKAHPLGRIISQTQVCEFKSPRSNIQWATKRKRK